MFGDVGISPGTSFTGTGVVDVADGDKHVADTAAANGIAALLIAYNDARDRGADRVSTPHKVNGLPSGHNAPASCIVEISDNLGGWTLTPGLYRATSSIIIKDNDLTLDAEGVSSAVFIFQMAKTFETNLGSIILYRGADAKFIFWQVGTSAHIGVGTTMYGTILADQSITSGVGARLHGRALARIASVTMLAAKMALPTLAASKIN
jgi:hypothetical protein